MSEVLKVFISASTGDLGSVRELVKQGLLTMHCLPVEQTNFAPDYRTVAAMLEKRIAECDAVIHLVGLRYGAEPDPATLPAGAARRSYGGDRVEIGVASDVVQVIVRGRRGQTPIGGMTLADRR
jgi:hypothetical protein